MLILCHFLIAALWISLYDIRRHLIKKIHLQILFIPLLPFINARQLTFGILNWALYLFLYGISRKGIGFGDVRLALLVGIYIGTYVPSVKSLLLFNLLGWITAGFIISIRALFSNHGIGSRTAFAPYLFLTAGFGLFIK